MPLKKYVLHAAAYAGNEVLVRLLLDNGADATAEMRED